MSATVVLVACPLCGSAAGVECSSGFDHIERTRAVS